MGSDLIGKKLGEYRIDEFVGGGGFADVYKGYQERFDRTVAIKVLDGRLAKDARFIERFRREAENTFSLQHPNIVKVFDFKEADGLYFMAMEFINGPTLRKWLSQKGGFNVQGGEEDVTRIHEGELHDDVTVLRELTSTYQLPSFGLIAQIGIDVCNALNYAHKEKVIHRDVKPDNVLLSPDGRALLVDFGIARAQEDSRLTRTKAAIGSLAYMSPEQIRGEKEIDGRSDIYSFGIMMYEILTGTVPFVGTDTSVWQMHLKEEPPKPTTLRGDIPEKLEKIVLKCLRKETDARYKSAGEVAKAIRDTVHPTPISVIFETGKEKPKGKKKESRKEKAQVICSKCGYLAEVEKQVEICAACGLPYSENDFQLTPKLMAAGENFIAALQLKKDLSLDVRAYEYDRVIELELGKKAREALFTWQDSLSQGSLVYPTSQPEKRPDREKLLKSLSSLNDVINLWESPAVSSFVVSLEARRRRKEFLAELKSKTCFQYGTLHSLNAARSDEHSLIVNEYATARAWFEKAKEVLEKSDEKLTRAIENSILAISMIMDYRNDPKKTTTRLEELRGKLEKVDFLWAARDAEQSELLCRLQDQIKVIPQEYDLLHHQVKVTATQCQQEVGPNSIQLSSTLQSIEEKKNGGRTFSLVYFLAFSILLLISLIISAVMINNIDQHGDSGPSIIIPILLVVLSIIFLSVGSGIKLGRDRKAFQTQQAEIAALETQTKGSYSVMVKQSDLLLQKQTELDQKVQHARDLLSAAYLYKDPPDLFKEHNKTLKDLSDLKNTISTWREDSHALVQQIIKAGSKELYHVSGASFRGMKGNLCFEVSNLVFRIGGAAGMEDEERNRHVIIRIPRNQVSNAYMTFNRVDVWYAGQCAQFFHERRAQKMLDLINQWLQIGRQ